MLNTVVSVVVAGLMAVGAAAGGGGATGASTGTAAEGPGGRSQEVHAFGTADYLGSPAELPLAEPIVAMDVTPSGDGYWLVAADGGIFTYGDAEFLGSPADLDLVEPIVAMAATPTGAGYWLVAADGGIFAYGDARFEGSAGDLGLAAPIVAMAATPSGGGYWLAAADGGIFNYGDARFLGSVGPDDLSAPIESLIATTSGRGYWLAAADGAVFTFGDARYFGSAVDVELAEPVRAMAPTPTGEGYWLFAGDGGVFDYGDAEFLGAGSGLPANQRVADAAADRDGFGYWLAARRLPRMPLRGNFVERVPDRPALAVKIDDAPPAVPQWGLDRTDIVIEEIVEGEITRFVAIFHSRGADPVGPVRSARTTDIHLLELLGRPLFGFSGGNQGVRATVAAADVVDLNHGNAPGAYYRLGSRFAPHNLLTSSDALRDLDPGAPPTEQVFEYRPPGASRPESATPAEGVELVVGGVSVGWRWDGPSGRWLRSQRGSPHLSASDGAQLGAKNLVVMFTDYVASGVDARSPEAVSIGEGEVWVFIDGTVVTGRWVRPSAASPLRFVDGDGDPIWLEPGNTWLELPRPGTGTVVGG